MKNTKTYYFKNIGNITITEENNFVTAIDVNTDAIDTGTESSVLLSAQKQLSEYFLGTRKIFDLPIKQNGTEFQLKVWNELRKIPYGKVVTYKEVAKNIGHPKAVRAVGNANNKNKLTFVVPCHRVIGTNGKLVGYAHGLDIKQTLIKLEKQNS